MAETKRGTCPDCGRDFALTRSGDLRKHDCTVADLPQSPSTAEQTAHEERTIPADLRERELPMVAGRPKCSLPRCELPEFMDNVGLCGGHWATRPDLRREARRG